MSYEFDPQKSQSNKAKHGVDFVEAQALWADFNRLEFKLLTSDEKRYAVIGKIDGKVWTAIITYRGEAVRIISVRRARENEEKIYYS